MQQPLSARGRILCLGLVLGAWTTTLQADEIYRWVDSQGRVHFSDSTGDIPEQYRSQLRDISKDLLQNNNIRIIPGLNQPPPGQEDEKKAPAGGFDLLSRLGNLPGPEFIGILIGGVIGLWIHGFILTLCCSLAHQREPAMFKAMGVVFLQSVLAGVVGGIVGVGMGIEQPPEALGEMLPALAIGLPVAFVSNTGVIRATVSDSMKTVLKISALQFVMVVTLAAVVIGGLALFGYSLQNI